MNCGQFEDALPAILDGALDGEERARCARHAATCASCRELVEPMGESLAPVAVDPPASLLAAVLARTIHEPSWAARWAETWRQWMLRPRFASEAAFVGVVVLSMAAVRVSPRTIDAETEKAKVAYEQIRGQAGNLLDRAASLLDAMTTKESKP